MTVSAAFISIRVRANSKPRGPKRGMIQPTIGRSQAGIRLSGRPPAARSTFAMKPLTAFIPFASCGTGCLDDDVIAQYLKQFLSAFIAHQQPLLALSAHVTDRDVREGVRIIHACAAGEGEEVGRELRDR